MPQAFKTPARSNATLHEYPPTFTRFNSSGSNPPMRSVFARIFSLIVLLCITVQPCRADEGIALFEKKIRPVLVKHCYECHSEKSPKLQGGLRVDTATTLLRGGDSGLVIVRGRPSESLLLESLKYESFEMPPKGKLPDAIIADFERWIEMGAPLPQDKSVAARPDAKKQIDFAEARKHWAYQPLNVVPVPQTTASTAWAKRGVDHFLYEKMSAEKLRPSPQADPMLLLRRVSYDLTGLPPSYDDVVRFEADPSDEAYAAYVENLLASPTYGEHWGRQWMDVVRYADTNPTSEATSRPEPFAFGYRDWIIDAWNRDLPYDRFIRYQIAADGYGSEGAEYVAALGFISLGLTYHKDLKLDRDVIETLAMDDWDDRVDAFSRGILGLTVSCARCHDHKFDAFTQADYYGLAGVFASVRGKKRVVGKLADAGDAEAAAVEVELQESARLRREANKYRFKLMGRFMELNQQAGRLDSELLKKYSGKVAFGLEDGGTWFERGEHDTIPVFRAGVMRDLPVYARGAVNSPGETVPRRFPALFTDGKALPFTQGSGRRELAENLFSKSTVPLTARVIANRMWGWHFGKQLVPTPSDFGTQGERPTHPELLDYLADYLIQHNWSLKALHREIVLSAAFRQSAHRPTKASAVDESNRLLSYFPMRRLSAEQYRDSILQAAGSLKDSPTPGAGFPWTGSTMGDRSRRSVYARIDRPRLPTYLIQFNFPDPMLHSPARREVTSATQNLFLLNSPFMMEFAGLIAAKFKSKTDEAFLERAFRTLYLRDPSETEQQLFLAQLHAWKKASDNAEAAQTYGMLIHGMLITNEFLYLR